MSQNLERSFTQGTTDSPVADVTIGDCFDAITDRYPDNLAIVVRHQSIRWTFTEYKDQVERLARGLIALGINKGDRVGIWAPNCIEWSLTQFATAKIGAILVCLNPAYRTFEIKYALQKSGCRAIIAAEKFETSDYLGMLQNLIPELDSGNEQLASNDFPKLKYVIRTGDGRTSGMQNFDDILRLGDDVSLTKLRSKQQELSPGDPINIQFTSGTTGSPKGATLTHRNILNNGRYVAEAMRFTENDRLCIPVPLYHCFGMVMGNLACLSKGAAAIFPNEKFDPAKTLQAVEKESCTALHGVPTMFIAELSLPEFDGFDLSSLRTGIMAGAPCPIETMKQVLSEMHMSEVLIAYGQTECSPVNLMTSPDDTIEKRISTVGRVMPNLEIKIADENGNPQPIGVQGEICCRGYAVMQGYWDDEVQTRDTIDSEGWLHSGDLGTMDEEGYVKVTGRIKDMIIRGGENIYPREIEEYLLTHPKITEVQVFGVPDSKFGEQICAWIKPKPGSSLSEQDVLDFCAGTISHYKIPRYVQFVDEFPMTVTGKPQKFVMRDQAIESLQLVS